MIFDSNEFDSENIAFLLHVPSAVSKFALLQTAVITAGFYFKKYQEKDLVQNHFKFSEPLSKKVCFISGFTANSNSLFHNYIRK